MIDMGSEEDMPSYTDACKHSSQGVGVRRGMTRTRMGPIGIMHVCM